MNLKYLVKFFLCYSPNFLKAFIMKLNKIHEKKCIVERMYRTKVSKDDVHKLLLQISITGDVMLHTSKVNIGDIEGGTEFLANEIMSKLDLSKQTLLVSALPYRGAFADYLEKTHVFNVKSSPIAMGSINRYIASMPNAIRSLHPTHSVVALGKNAAYYVNEHSKDLTPFGEHSPYYKLIINDGQVLLFGATLNNLTCVCAVEDMLGEVYSDYLYSKKLFTVQCIDYDNNIVEVSTRCHDPRKAIKRDLSFVHDDLIRQGIMKTFPLGEAEVSLINIKPFTIYYLKLLDSGISNRGKIRVSKELHDKINAVINSLA